jgi:DNA-nicking Smr family endonuclease
MSRKRPLSDDERVLWRTITRSVAPLRGRKAEPDEEIIEAPQSVQAGSPHGAKRTARRAARDFAARHPGDDSPSPSVPALAPIDRRMKQKLARGTRTIDGRIDLHGLTQAEAHAALARFLRQAQTRGAGLVLVITGKGGGEGRGVLRRQVPLWLEGTEFRSLVIGFDAAGISHGGEGALYVRVRRGRA